MGARNELLQPQSEKTSIEERTSKLIWIKSIMFTVLWAFVAWQLLTIKEKNVPKYDVFVDSNQTISK